MSSNFPNDPNNSGSSRRSSREIPRRGYDRQRDATGTLRPPENRPSSRPIAPFEEDDTSVSQPPLPPNYGAARPSAPPSPPPPRRGRGAERAPRDSGLYLPWWSLLVLVLFVGGVSVGILLAVTNLSGAVLPAAPPQIIIVTSALDATVVNQINQQPPTPIASIPPTSQNFLPSPEPSRTPVPGGCLLGAEVIIFGTQGVGLNLRDEPGGEVAFIAKEGEKMLVIDGPVIFDDLQWCQVRSSSQSSSFGWAAQDFLIPADSVEGQ